MSGSSHDSGTVERTLEVLASRIVDQCADEQDWATYAALAQSATGGAARAWQRLAELQRDAAALGSAVEQAVSRAECARLPGHTGAGSAPRVRVHERAPRGTSDHVSARLHNRLSGAGWLVAACVGLAWVGVGRLSTAPEVPGPATTNTAGVNPAHWTINTPDDALRAYMDVGGKSGRVLGELPQRVIVQAMPVNASTITPGGRITQMGGAIGVGPSGSAAGIGSDDGQPVEVIYLRQIVERAVISDVVKFGTDDRGRPVPVRLPIQSFDARSE